MSSNNYYTRAAGYVDRLANDLNIPTHQAIGILGQLAYESSGLQAINEYNPIVKGSRGGYGWAQWTGPRRVAFENYAAANKMNVADSEANYKYLIHELTNTSEKSVLNRMNSAKNAQEAGELFTKYFLRPAALNPKGRNAWTHNIANAYNKVNNKSDWTTLRKSEKSWNDFNTALDKSKQMNSSYIEQSVPRYERMPMNGGYDDSTNPFEGLNKAVNRMASMQQQLAVTQPEPIVNTLARWGNNSTNNPNRPNRMYWDNVHG